MTIPLCYKLKDTNVSIYKAAKETGAPWSTLKDHLRKKQDTNDQVPKLGRLYALTVIL